MFVGCPPGGGEYRKEKYALTLETEGLLAPYRDNREEREWPTTVN